MLSCLLKESKCMVREVFKNNKFYYNLPPNTIALFCTAVQFLGLFLLILSCFVLLKKMTSPTCRPLLGLEFC